MSVITKSRIKWKCRRGLLELDIVFEKFCETVLPAMEQEEMDRFFLFLDTPDQILLDWLFTDAVPEGEDSLQFVLKLRSIGA